MTGPKRYEYHLRTVTVRASEPVDHWANIVDPETAARVIADLLSTMDRDADAEQFGIITSDSRQRCTGYKILTTGTKTQTPVDPAKLYRVALELDAAGVIAFHTHPSGDTKPSRDDLLLTERLVKAGAVLGLPLHDHIILDGADPHRAWLSLRLSRPGLFTAQMAL